MDGEFKQQFSPSYKTPENVYNFRLKLRKLPCKVEALEGGVERQRLPYRPRSPLLHLIVLKIEFSDGGVQAPVLSPALILLVTSNIPNTPPEV